MVLTDGTPPNNRTAPKAHPPVTLGVVPSYPKGGSTLPPRGGRGRLASRYPSPSVRSPMSQSDLKPLSESMKRVLERVDIPEGEAAHPRPLCPVGNPRCDGHGNVLEDDGMRTCECVRRFLRQGEIADTDIPKRFAKKGLENFKPRDPLAKAACVIAREYVEAFDPEEGRGLYVYGSTGTGKTHLAIGVLKALLNKNLNVEGAYFNQTALLDRIRRSMGESAPAGSVNGLTDRLLRPIVVLDDLGGVQKSSTWVRDRLYSIINAIYEDCRTLIITTTLRPAELARELDPSIVSRIQGMCKEIDLSGEDQRRIDAGKPRKNTQSPPREKTTQNVSVTQSFGAERPKRPGSV